MYDINTNYIEIMSGSKITTSKAYTEAAKSIDENTPAAMSKVKKFIISMEKLSKDNAVKDNRISSSKGNIKNFSGYENIKTVMQFLKDGLGNTDIVKDLSAIYDGLEKYQPLYSEGYNKNVSLVMLEYESVLYQLVTGLSLAMATELDVVQNGYSIKITKKGGFTHGTIHKTSKDLAKQLSSKSHKEYLEALLKMSQETPISPVNESSTFYEGTVLDILELVDAICGKAANIGKFTVNTIKNVKRSFFGIIPIIRGVLYIRYKNKADTIKSLEQQAAFVEQNIDRLQKRTNIDPKEKETLIKKQQAYVEAYKKKAEKLRAELTETEKEASTEIEKANEEIKDSSDDDFILEAVSLGNEVFTEKSNSLWKKNDRKFSIYGIEFELPSINTDKYHQRYSKDTPSDKNIKSGDKKMLKMLKSDKNIDKIEKAILSEERQVDDNTDDEIINRIKEYLSKAKIDKYTCTSKGNSIFKVDIPYIKNVECAWLEHEMWITSDGNVSFYDEIESYD